MVRAQIRSVVLVWLGWAALILGFQAFATARIDLVRPDKALDWTAAQTQAPVDRSDLSDIDAFVASHAAWDSQYYVSIALNGYDDPAAPVVGPGSMPQTPEVATRAGQPAWPSVNHAFLPGYPLAIRVVAWPLGVFGPDPGTAAVLAGVIVSLLGTLAAMVAAFDLARPAGDDDGAGLRAAFYLVIWPGSIFLAQVYSEGLFLGLSFGALALMRRGRWGWAALLAAAAVWTRSTGVLLVIPFAWTWFAEARPFSRAWRPSREQAIKAGCVAAPVLAYLLWRIWFGGAFDFVETHYFGRGLFWLGASWDDWQDAFSTLIDGDPQERAYRLVEIGSLAVGLGATALLWRRDKALAIYSLAILVVAATSGAAVGMQRYVLGAPALVLAAAELGRRPVFDRLWSLANGLGLAMLAITFSFGFWTG